MRANWYCIENDDTLGPMTLADLTIRIQDTGQSCLVWTEGMAEWMEAAAVPALSSLFRSAPGPSQAAPRPAAGEEPARKRPALKQRMKRELAEYLVISVYLYICFGALLFYAAAIRHSDGVAFAPFGFALVKALVIGKFILILQALGIGEQRGGAAVLVADILKKSVLFLLLLGVLTVVEEIIVGQFHGRTIAQSVGEIGGGTVQQVFATGILMLLILVPYFTYRVVSGRLGEGVLWKLLTKRHPGTSL